MKLEIKHLAPYLIHNLKLKRISFKNEEFKTLSGYDLCPDGEIDNIMPILYQLNLDNLTNEIEYNGEKIIPIYYIFNPDYKKFNHKMELSKATFSNSAIIVHIWANNTCYIPHRLELRSIISQNLPFYVFENLYKLHFDFYDLVINNLAVEKSNYDIKTSLGE